ncbi:hypothetical protein PAHAL_3G052400 [Panicum hallii]|uniref:Uncharacterized protein n=1 Tax=Panicum hallii TaxID=206008 RepID=A0A2T8KH63_9POAL|nr:hypothetical protein PAHAL_3G052400 [Panicum hallii]
MLREFSWEDTKLTKETNLRYREPATLRILVTVVKGTLRSRSRFTTRKLFKSSPSVYNSQFRIS